MSQISIDREKCILCEACVDTCPEHIFFMEESEVQIHHEEECISCGHCVSACPVDAVIHRGLNLAESLPMRESSSLSPEALYYFLRSRRSCRAYESKEVPPQILQKLVDMGRFAPTGHNIQNFEFIVIQDKAKIEKLSKMAAIFYGNLVNLLKASKEPIPISLKEMMSGFQMNYDFYLRGKDRIFRGAPVVILVHAPKDGISSIDNCLYALFHMVMMGHVSGLGTCINGLFVAAADRVPEIPKELELPAGHKIFGCVTVGYPKHTFHKLPSRKAAQVKWI